MQIDTILQAAAREIGPDIQLTGLIQKIARLKPKAEYPEDVLGFDYIVRMDDTCFEYYAANPPLIGMTQPVPVKCPLGIEVIDSYKVDYEEAVQIFHKGDWGSQFTSMMLSKPLVYPQAKEAYWYMVSTMGQQVIIGADTGEIMYPE